MYTPTDWERCEIERLRKKETNEPEFVTKRREELIALITEGKGREIVYDEWGEVYYFVDSDNCD